MYDSTSQNSFRHMAAWWMYQEWHEQLECDVQGFPNQFAGKSYEQHVQRAADMMDHTVEIHETTYLPVSPSHRTAQEEVGLGLGLGLGLGSVIKLGLGFEGLEGVQ